MMLRKFGVWGGGVALVANLGCSDAGDATPATATVENQPAPAASGSAPPGAAAPATPAATPPGTSSGTTPEGAPMPAAIAPPAPAAPAGAEAAAPAELPPAEVPPAPSFPGEVCSGCARFAVPMTAGDQYGMFELNLPQPVDMTSTTITWRLMAVGFTGTSGGVSAYVRDAENRDQCFIWTNLTALGAWTDVTCEFSQRAPGGMNATMNMFDPTTVAKIGVQIHSGGANAAATYANALVYLDSVKFSNGVSPDITFDTGIGGLTFLPDASTAKDGTSVAFLGQ